MTKRVAARYAAERRFRALGFAAVALSVGFLAFLLITMASRGLGGFTHTEARLVLDLPRSDIVIDPAALKSPDAPTIVAQADLDSAIAKSATATYGADATALFGESAARALGRQLIDDPTLLTRTQTVWLPVSAKVDVAAKANGDDAQEKLVTALRAKDSLRTRFNFDFLTASDATDPSVVGVWGALTGSFLTILVTMGLAFPVGVLAALYLEEFAPRNRVQQSPSLFR